MSKQTISNGKAVHFTYYITTDHDGSVVEQSDIPIGYVHGGYSALLEPVEAALDGCVEGDQIVVPLARDNSVWAYDRSLTYTDDIENVPQRFRHIGARVEMMNALGEARTFFVTEIKDGKLTVDGNHPLAGKAVTFHVTVHAIRKASPDEIRAGRPEDSPAEGRLLH